VNYCSHCDTKTKDFSRTKAQGQGLNAQRQGKGQGHEISP